ncbi:MAG TPA: hypothetical protein VE714_11690 [Gemmatimonadales bacterium]|nr:hypothetical protein [Gemmatimonadales bacterium]
MRLSHYLFVVTCLSLFGAACSERSPVAPRPRMSLNASLTTLVSRSHPNSEKYRDAGFQPAIGRSGTAVVSTRALVDKAGVTTLDVTTGTFDAAGPGSLVSLQVKGFTPSGSLGFTKTYTGLTGSAASLELPAAPRGMALQLQALVQSAAGPRTDVVNVADVVRYRPDLAATHLYLPDQAPSSVPVNIQATIQERNGDVGARADCVLYVDGIAADRADGIWIDAGGTVDCYMAHVFPEQRNYALEMRVENVQPGDFDAANNAVSRSIAIIQPSGLGFFGLTAQSAMEDDWWRYVYTFTTWEGVEETWDQTYHLSGPLQYASVQALIPRSLAFPIALHGTMRTNNGTVNILEQTIETADYLDYLQAYCSFTYDVATGSGTYVCVYTGGYLNGYTSIQYDAGGADVHYLTESYVTFWDASGQLNARWIYGDYWDSRPMVTYGADFTGSLSVQGANDLEPASAQMTVQLQPWELRADFGGGDCSALGNVGCYEAHFHSVGVLGYGSWGEWPPYVP